MKRKKKKVKVRCDKVSHHKLALKRFITSSFMIVLHTERFSLHILLPGVLCETSHQSWPARTAAAATRIHSNRSLQRPLAHAPIDIAVK